MPRRKIRANPFQPADPRRAFSIIEVVAAASIILVLALILVPVLRNRVSEAKVVAAQADIEKMVQAQQIAYGYANRYFRLNDLFRADTDATGAIDPGTPWFQWNGQRINRALMEPKWKGPYLTPKRTQTLMELISNGAHQAKFRSDMNLDPLEGEGPILVAGRDAVDPAYPEGENPYRALEFIEYPIDPWGNPYLFFGTGRIPNDQPPGATIPAAITETTYSEIHYPTAVIFSLGPDGRPGDDQEDVSENYYREAVDTDGNPILGSGDDLKQEF